MIHVATVHYQSNKWIDIQLAYLRRHLHEPYRVVASLEAVPGHQEAKFDRVGMTYSLHDLQTPNVEDLEALAAPFRAKGLNTTIGGRP